MPLERNAVPRIGARDLAPEERVNAVKQNDEQADAQDLRADRGQLVEQGELVQVLVVAAWHALRPKGELREEGQIESHENEEGCDLGPPLAVHPAGHLGPPMVQSTQERDHRAAHHHVVKVRNHEVGVVQVHVDRERAEEHPRQAADRKQHDERKGIDHRSIECDRTTIQRRYPAEHLDGRRHRHRKREERKDHAGEVRLATHEHVMAPHEEADDGDGHTRQGNRPVAEDVLP